MEEEHCMEEQASRFTPEKLFSGAKQQLRTTKNVGKFQPMHWTKADERIKPKRRQSLSSCYNSLEMPLHAMEFLCRSWSPSAADFLQTFSSNNQVLALDDKQVGQRANDMEDNGGYREKDDGKENELKSHIPGNTRVADLPDRTWSKLVIGRSMPNILQTYTTRQDQYKISMKHMKEFLKGKSLTSILRRYRKEKKEEARIITAKMHAAVSVAQLAAAIAGLASTQQAEKMDAQQMILQDTNMGSIFASAAALVASACAESAELTGVGKAHVASAVSCGLAAQSPADLLTLIATAATCLRGAATLNSRAVPGLHAPRIKDLKLDARLSIITSSGQRVERHVSIHSKHGQLRLSLEKKYLGILATTREYTIQNAIAEKRSSECYLLNINCEGGAIKLLFKDEQQSLAWMSSISNVLSCEQISMAKI